MVKDMMDAWMPRCYSKEIWVQEMVTGHLLEKQIFHPNWPSFFSFSRKLLKQCERHSRQRLLMVSALESP